jgi:hypothetical protein
LRAGREGGQRWALSESGDRKNRGRKHRTILKQFCRISGWPLTARPANLSFKSKKLKTMRPGHATPSLVLPDQRPNSIYDEPIQMDAGLRAGRPGLRNPTGAGRGSRRREAGD